MIITLPRHVAQSADLSARARIPVIASMLVSAALFLARLDDRLQKPVCENEITEHLARDTGLDRINQNAEPPRPSGSFPMY